MSGVSVFLLAGWLATGCASPGPPRAPSLQLPAIEGSVTATRRAPEVELAFTVSTRTTDGLPYRGTGVRASVCRAVGTGSCLPVAGLSGVPLPVPGPAGAPGGNASRTAGAAPDTVLRDVLPPALATGPVRLLTYRVELSNTAGRTAGFGDAAYTAAGAPPAPVTGLRAGGSRDGIVVRWLPEDDPQAAGDDHTDVVLRRELVGSTQGINGKAAGKDVSETRKHSGAPNARSSGTPGVVWLSTTPVADPLQASGDGGKRSESVQQATATDYQATATNRLGGVVDDSAVVDSTYRYEAERQRSAQVGGHRLVLHSVLSPPVEATLHAQYPPPAPTNLVGTAFPLPAGEGSDGQAAGLAVDLIWTPADDREVTGGRTVGYKVTREVLDAEGAVLAPPALLTATPVATPAYHDVLPAVMGNGAGARRLRYRVVAVDARGLESAPVVTVVDIGR